MPDPVTHLCTALFPKALLGGRYTGVFAVGVSLPDIASRLPTAVLERAYDRGFIPREAMYPWATLHMPIGIAVSCALLTFLFPEKDRPAVFGWLLGGGALHLAADLLQFHYGQGYYLLFPFSLWRFELGWVGSEATVPLAPWFAAATAIAWGYRWTWERRRAVK